ncbi:MAG: hypothetical protein IJ654_03050 [Bacteroidales bacterium]|nr:hypothetical protein [Bacteroidales bacterium]
MKTSPLLSLALTGLLALAGCNHPNPGNTADGSAATAASAQGAITAAPAPASETAAPAAASPVAVPSAERLSPDEIVPEIRFIGKGSILPSSGSLDLPFRSTGYAKAQVRVRKVFSSNILQFMQNNGYDARYELDRVARVIADTTLVLGSPDAPHIREAKTYALSVDEMVRPEPGAVYYVEIRGREPLTEETFYDSDYSFGNYDTYRERRVSLLCSNLALLAKQGDKDLDVYAFDILSGRPAAGVRIKLYDYVRQELAKGVSDRSGHLSIPVRDEARFLVAQDGASWSYLDLRKEKALTTSNFEVSGTTHKDGIKAYIFGERGVWRPGDTLHIGTVILFDNGALPAGHPIVATLRNADGQVVQTLTRKYDGKPLFHFPFTTQSDAATGRWTIQVEIGGQTFTKPVRIETIKPNKLDIDLQFAAPVIRLDGDTRGTVAVNWLYGAPGSGLKVDGELDVTPAKTRFKGFESFDFKDDARAFDDQKFTYSGLVTDSSGRCSLDAGVKLNRRAVPGLLTAGFTLRAYEPSGEFSTGYSEFRLSPFDVYVGLKTRMDVSPWKSEYLKRGVSHRFEVATVDPDGKGVSVGGLHAEIYHVDWSWWWNSSSEIASYMAGSSKELVFEERFSTTDGHGTFSFDWARYPAGTYYVRVTDEQGGHATSLICDVNEDAGEEEVADGATRLAIRTDKECYAVGETARLVIPSSKGSQVLVSIEKGGRLLRSELVTAFEGSTEIRVPVTADMQPNAYAFVTLIQPYQSSLNDAPIRLYGVRNLTVEDPSSHLHPQIEIADEIKPETQVRFKVKEKDGRAMHYVVALVDEGLLSLTGYKTPDAWNSFYAKEALRVRTWDLYDDIIGAYGGHIEQLFAIGGDDEASGPLKRRKADRFTPVVSWLGPFELKPGKSATHTVAIPQYIGSLRAMVVASDGKAQGSCQKNVNVTQPVMVQATLPRTVSVGERIQVPVTLFSLKDGVGKVRLSLQADKAFSVTGPSSVEVLSEKEGQQIEYFELQVGEKTGIGHVSVTAAAGGERSRHDIELDILSPNPEVTRVQTAMLKAGESRTVEVDLFGLDGTNALSVEWSAILAINLQGRMKYLRDYPYGCLEQTVSAVFPQLYLGQVSECSADEAALGDFNIQAALRRLQSFRRGDGSLSYWPGTPEASPFGSVYALHFLQEAENAGYAVPADLKKTLLAYVTTVVKDTKAGDFVRAYGLYALAACGRPQRGVMNVMRSAKGQSNHARWLLAAAYACDGKADIAREMTAGLPYTETDRTRYYDGYGSEDRNKAIALKVLRLVGDQEAAFKLAAGLAASLNDASHYMSTQSTAWALYALCDYAANMAGQGISGTARTGGKTLSVETPKSLAARTLLVDAPSGRQTLTLTNKGTAPVYAVTSMTGIPAAGEEQAQSAGLSMEIRYIDEKGAALDVSALQRGQLFKAVTVITNRSGAAVRDIALAERFPSGWEIKNERVYKTGFAYPAGITYQDFRDDRVYSFFNLGAGESVTVSLSLTATYPGRFYLPAVSCEAMYDSSVTAVVPGRWVEVK